jgi:hypothetical protein
VIVYLDSAHLALLERASADGRRAFFRTWGGCKCQLALSLHHLQEIGQLSDRTSVARRLQVLDDFPIIRCKPAGYDLVLQLEIAFQLARARGLEPNVTASALATLFPKSTAIDVSAAVNQYPWILAAMRPAHETGAEASNYAKQAEQQTRGVRKRKLRTPSGVDEHQIESLLESTLAELPPQVQTTVRDMWNRVRDTIRERGGLRLGLEEVFGLSDLAIRHKIPDADLPSISVFYDTARTHWSSIASPAEMVASDPYMQRLDPYAARGFALQLAVRRGRKRHTKPDEASDEIDVAHIAFAPYVDVLFVDKRTLGFVHQERRDNPALLPFDFTNTIERAGSLQRVEEILVSRFTAADQNKQTGSGNPDP